MPPQIIADSPFLETVWAIGIFLVFILVAWLILLVIKRARQKQEARKAKQTLIVRLLHSLSRPIFLLLLSQGLILALSSVSYLATWRPYLGKASIILVIILVTYGLTQGGQLLLSWYLRRVKVRRSLSRLVQRIAILLVYIGGLLVLLDYLGIAISPMIAGLGLGGLAIALALQPTLNNFFAGAQIVSDRMVHVGDYIQLDSGESGYVVDVGWRSTRVRTAFNNMMVIPNSRLVDSIITNYYGPDMELAVIVESGVSYSSDLAKVEDIVMAVAREVIEEVPGTVKTHEPWFGYDEFGDSNINFWIWLYATDRISSFRVKSELIKRLHTRFAQKGITINYPVRLLTYEDSKGKNLSSPQSNAPTA